MLDKGVSWSLAESRSKRLRLVKYHISLRIEKGVKWVKGETVIAFHLEDNKNPLIVDFAGKTVYRMEVNNQLVDRIERIENHIVLDSSLLKAGENKVRFQFSSRINEQGAALTRFKDPKDGKEYLYTLFVPADAHVLFPCFDQPDLKATTTLSLTVPEDWIAVANSPLSKRCEVPNDRGFVRYDFLPSRLISTYLIAFAAGPFTRIENEHHPSMSLYVRQSKKKDTDSATLFKMHNEATVWLEKFLDTPYPFQKFDFVLIPAFPYGGMEHAGAIFYRESQLVFDGKPSVKQLFNRAILIYHELAHQWFGDLVTMKWFDDLWLKEGFATYLSYRLLDDLHVEEEGWKRFNQEEAPKAFAMELTRGTTPIFQKLDNLADAKSTYSAIVYNKAPVVLRQLEFYCGQDSYQNCLRLFLKRYPYSCASWKDFICCCEEVIGKDLTSWAKAWLTRRGMPVVSVEPDIDQDGKLKKLIIDQRGYHNPDALWPFKIRVALVYPGNEIKTIDVEVADRTTEVLIKEDIVAPSIIFANYSGYSYGRFPLDERSLNNVQDGIGLIQDLHLRSLLYDVLWDMTKAAELAPINYLAAAMKTVNEKSDPLDLASILKNVKHAFRYYLSSSQISDWGPTVEMRVRAVIEDSRASSELKQICFKAFLGFVTTDDGLDWLKGILKGQCQIRDITLSPEDRWNIIKRLLVTGQKDAESIFDEEKETDESLSSQRYSFVTEAAFPDRSVKEYYFDLYKINGDFPESWLESSLKSFNAIGQSELTLPYLRSALNMIEVIRENRKIFFLQRWLDSFITSHRRREALEIVQDFLEEHRTLSPDLKGKIMQSLDSLERTIIVRERYGKED